MHIQAIRIVAATSPEGEPISPFGFLCVTWGIIQQTRAFTVRGYSGSVPAAPGCGVFAVSSEVMGFASS
jgi:hypothetical protein